MGRAGHEKVMREFTEDAYFNNLMAVYQTAIQRSRNRVAVSPLVQISTAAMPSGQTD
jgi:hypothetical protein